MSRSHIRGLFATFLAWCFASVPLLAQCPSNQVCDDVGAFVGPWQWEAQICAAPTGCDSNKPVEFYHGAVLPKGLHAGMVLLTRVDIGGPNCDNAGTLQSWLFNPTNPETLIHIQHSLAVPDYMNCAGNALDPQGRVVMVGGSLDVGSTPNKRVYRFDPDQLGLIQYSLDNPLPCSPHRIVSNPWTRIGDLAVGRYYATATLLTRQPINHPGGATHGLGSAVIALGGPPHATLMDPPEGNEVWELLHSSTGLWAPPLVPDGYLGSFANQTVYARESIPPEPPPSPLLDSYPRAFQFSKDAQRQIFMAGDTRTVKQKPAPLPEYDNVALTGKETWTIKIPYANVQLPPSDWELWRSRETGTEHFYGNVVLLFRRNNEGQLRHDRLLLIGGGQFTTQTPFGLTSVTDVVREYIPGSDSALGQWRSDPNKAKLNHPRIHANSVLLPDGRILVVGGFPSVSHTDDPIFAPEIYDPGPEPLSLGSSTTMAESNDANWGPGNKPVPRRYHSMAFLLPDGRVFMVGGRHLGAPWPDSRLSGEIFYPPYLFEGNQLAARPTITGVLTSHASFQRLSTPNDLKTFEVDVVLQTGSVRMVSAIRVSSVTHHLDTDQRFIELSYTEQVSGTQSTLTVEAPDEDIAPQGWYHLFVLEERNGRSIPSVGKLINFQ